MQTQTIQLRELTVRYSVRKNADGQPVVIGRTLRKPSEAAEVLMTLLQDEPSEVFAILCLSTKLRVIGYHIVGRGTLDSVMVHPRLCWTEHKRGYVVAAVMWRSRFNANGERALTTHGRNITRAPFHQPGRRPGGTSQ